MIDLVRHAAWVLLVTFVLSLAYELYRATIKAGTSRHDSMRAFVQTLPLYVVAATVVATALLLYEILGTTLPS